MRITINVTKIIDLPPSGLAPTEVEITLLAAVDACVTAADEAVIVGGQVRSVTFVERHVLEVLREGGRANVLPDRLLIYLTSIFIR